MIYPMYDQKKRDSLRNPGWPQPSCIQDVSVDSCSFVGAADVQHRVGCGGSWQACESIALCKSHVAQNKINGCKI